jgi:hypothetical protein
MQGLLAFVVSVALMAQLCESSDSSHEEDRQAPTRPPNAPFGGYAQPAYLRVPNFQDCLGTKMGPGSSWCLPAKRPAKCPTTSWPKLVSDPIFGKCA